jgi:hypothetical protein
VAVVQRPDGRVEPLLFDSSPLLLSAVFAEPDGRISVGRDALHSSRLEPGAYEPHPKRRIDDQSLLLGTVEFPVADLVTAVLRRVQQEASRVIGRLADEVVMTYPAGWGPTRRDVLSEAARAAGLGTPALVPEPLAAAWYFSDGLGHRVPVGGALVIYDFGAGTFDAAVVRRDVDGWAVLAVDGLDDVGGVDLDNALVDSFRDRLRPDQAEVWARLTNPQSTADRRYRRMLWEDVRAAKEKLSRTAAAGLPVPLLDVDMHVTRESFEQLARPWLERTMTTTVAAVTQAGIGRQDLVGVLLAGGSSRIPLVATLLHQRLGVPPTVTEQPELVVAQGSLLAPARSLDGQPTGPPVSGSPGTLTLSSPQSGSLQPGSAASGATLSGAALGGTALGGVVPSPGVASGPAFPPASAPVPERETATLAPSPERSAPAAPILPDAGQLAARSRNPWLFRSLIALVTLVTLGAAAAGVAVAPGWFAEAGNPGTNTSGGTDSHALRSGGPSGPTGSGAPAQGSATPSGSKASGQSHGPSQAASGGQGQGQGQGQGGSGTQPIISPPPIRPGPVTESNFQHVASSANIAANYTDLDNALTNNNPGAVLFVTPNYGSNAVYDNHAIGVWYHSGKWSIFNQDQSPMPAGAAFNVHAASAPAATVSVHVATSANSTGNTTDISNTASDGKPAALVWITPNWAPASVYNNHATGVWYANSGKWSVFNQDIAEIPGSAAFNVSVGAKGAKATFTHTASNATISGNWTDLSNPATDGHPNALLMVTPTWNPPGSSGVYDNHHIGVWYHDGKWAVFNQDQSAMPAGAAFNIAVFGG